MMNKLVTITLKKLPNFYLRIHLIWNIIGCFSAFLFFSAQATKKNGLQSTFSKSQPVICQPATPSFHTPHFLCLRIGPLHPDLSHFPSSGSPSLLSGSPFPAFPAHAGQLQYFMSRLGYCGFVLCSGRLDHPCHSGDSRRPDGFNGISFLLLSE